MPITLRSWMPPPSGAPVARLRSLWQRLSPLPGGRWLFSRILGLIVPYSGTLRASVLHFAPGHVRVGLRDRRGVRNHLRSVHAIALANLGELATGLAMMGALPPTVRGIVTAFGMEYHKKARGYLVAESCCVVPTVTDDEEFQAVASITDDSGDVVATVRATWRLGPVPQVAE